MDTDDTWRAKDVTWRETLSAGWFPWDEEYTPVQPVYQYPDAVDLTPEELFTVTNPVMLFKTSANR